MGVIVVVHAKVRDIGQVRRRQKTRTRDWCGTAPLHAFTALASARNTGLSDAVIHCASE